MTSYHCLSGPSMPPVRAPEAGVPFSPLPFSAHHGFAFTLSSRKTKWRKTADQNSLVFWDPSFSTSSTVCSQLPVVIWFILLWRAGCCSLTKPLQYKIEDYLRYYSKCRSYNSLPYNQFLDPIVTTDSYSYFMYFFYPRIILVAICFTSFLKRQDRCHRITC